LPLSSVDEGTHPAHASTFAVTSDAAATRRLPAMLWLIWALFIVYGCTIPFHFVSDWRVVTAHWGKVTFDLFASPVAGRLSLPDFVGNILLFMPFGVFGSLALPRRSRLRLVVVVALAAVLSAAVEMAQLFTDDRVTAMCDVTANVMGAFLGGLSAEALRAAFVRVMRQLHVHGMAESPALYPALVGLAAGVASEWEPFNVSLDIGEVVGKVKILRSDPFQFTGLNDEGVVFCRFLLAGFAAHSWLSQTRYRERATAITIVGTVVLGLGLESGQFFIGARVPGVEDAMIIVSGAITGAILARWHIERWRPVALAALLLTATAASAAMQMLSPFTWSAQHQGVNWFPFLGYYQWTSFLVVSHSFELLLMYFPLGFCLPLIVANARRATTAVVASTIALSVGLEWAQGWIIGRYSDVTDIGIALLGALIGLWMARTGWTRFRLWLAAWEPQYRAEVTARR
jgi:glycopeptide antibiotics resistance protein